MHISERIFQPFSQHLMVKFAALLFTTFARIMEWGGSENWWRSFTKEKGFGSLLSLSVDLPGRWWRHADRPGRWRSVSSVVCTSASLDAEALEGTGA